MKALLVARKSLLEILREPQLLGLTLALPLIFVAITALSYSVDLQTSYSVLVIDPAGQSTELLDELNALQYADGDPVLDIELADDLAAAELELEEHQVSALLKIDPHSGEPTIKGDALYGPFYRASVILNSAINRYYERLAGRTELVQVIEQPLTAAGPENEFDLYAPGMIMMGLLLIIPQTAMLVARELRWGTLHRLRLSALNAWELLGGISLAQMIMAVVQVVAVFGGALAFGFNNRGSLGLAVLVGLVVSFSAVGLGLITACFSENDSQAANVGGTFTMLQVFLSGSFYPIPSMTLFTIDGHQIELFDIFPATHGFSALQQVLTYGAGFQEIAFRLGMTALLSAVYFAAGVLIFRRLKLRSS